MPVGLECYNAAGQRTFEVGAPVAKFFGVASIGYTTTGTATTGTITDSRFTAYALNEPFVAVIDGGVDVDGNCAVFSFSGNDLTWVFPNGAGAFFTRPPTTFVYGVF